MNVLLFGATGMIGGGVLTECLEDPSVGSIVSIGRSASGRSDPKLREIVVPDLFELAAERKRIGTFDVCLYCLGVSSAGMSEEKYRRITVDLTVSIADAIEPLNPDLTLCFISGRGSGGGAMWARVKGEAEDAVLSRSFTTYVLRPGYIQPVKGARSRTGLYRALYAVLGPFTPILKKMAPDAVTTSAILGRAMIRVAADGYETPILETSDINAAGGGG